VIVIGLGTPRSARENFGYTWEQLGVPATGRGALVTCLGAPPASLGAPATLLGAPPASLGAPRITVEQSGKNNIIFGNVAGAPGNHAYYLSFNDSYKSCI